MSRNHKNYLASLFYLSCGLLVCTFVAAQPVDLQIRVLDQNQQPVADAIVIDPGTPALSFPESSPTDIAVMDQQNKEFKPRVLAIRRGQKVSFPNSDNIRHHVYSFSETKRFEIRLYADTPESPIEFERGGVVVLGCNIHDSMLGYIFVSDWQHFTQTDPEGIALLKQVNSTPKRLAVWHPEQIDPTSVQTVETPTWNNLNANSQSTTIVIQRKPLPAPSNSSRFRYGS